MRFHHLLKAAVATGGAALLTAAMATTAGAHNPGHTFNFSASSATLNASANYTSALTFGAHEADSMTIDMAAGFKLAHADTKGNELSSNPNDEESIGDGSAKASWWELFRCDTHVKTLAITWEEDMAGAPAGAVAHYQVAASIGVYDVWAIEEDDATNNYKLTVDLDQTWTCASSSQPSDANVSLNILGTTTGGRKVSENPGTNGCYAVAATFVEVSTPAVTHGGTDSQAFGSGVC